MAKNYHLKLKGFVGGADFDKDYVDYKLESHCDEDVDVLIDSLGGEVSTGFSIMSAFREHGRVAVHFRGMNASAATVASLGAKRITMDSSAMYLIHKCSQLTLEWASLNADQLRAKAEEYLQRASDLEKIDMNIAQQYASRCKKNPEDLLELMKAGGWLNAEETLEWGFIDEIVYDPNPTNIKLNRATANALNAAGIPLPNIPIEDEDSLLKKIAALFKSKETTNTKTYKNMKLKTLGSLLATDQLCVDDENNASVSADQLQTIEDSLAAKDTMIQVLNKEKEELQDKILNLSAELKTLRNTPAAETKQVVDMPSSKDAQSDYDNYYKSYNAAKSLYDSVG